MCNTQTFESDTLTIHKNKSKHFQARKKNLCWKLPKTCKTKQAAHKIPKVTF